MVKKSSRKSCRKRCIHGEYKFRCMICSPNSFCMHRKYKQRCSECDGSDLCNCGSGRFPSYNSLDVIKSMFSKSPYFSVYPPRIRCLMCRLNNDIVIKGKVAMCGGCFDVVVPAPKDKYRMTICDGCLGIGSNGKYEKRLENKLFWLLCKNRLFPSYRDKSIRSCSSLVKSRFRPDFVFVSDKNKHIVVLECDERNHIRSCVMGEIERENKIREQLDGYTVDIIHYFATNEMNNIPSLIYLLRHCIKKSQKNETFHINFPIARLYQLHKWKLNNKPICT